MCTRQTQYVLYRLAMRDPLGVVEGQYRLIVGTGKQETDIGQQGHYGQGKQQDTDDHSRLACHKEMLGGLPPVHFLHAYRPLCRAPGRDISQFS